MTDMPGTIGAAMLIVGVLCFPLLLFGDHLRRFFPVLVCLVVFGIALLIPPLVRDNEAKTAAFMEACQKDHKEYECTVMWRAGACKTSLLPIIIGGGK